MQTNVKMQQEISPIDEELERQLEELRGVIQQRKSRSRKLWEGHKSTGAAEPAQEQKKAVGKFTLYVTKYEW